MVKEIIFIISLERIWLCVEFLLSSDEHNCYAIDPPSLQRNKNKQSALLSVLCNKMYFIVLAAHMHISMELDHGYDICQGWNIDAQATLKTHACLLGFMNG